ncbi:MAG: endonuclease MutS2 [Bacteroidota bacterium]
MKAIYPDNFEVKIGFDRIRELLKNKCLSSMGEELADEMGFMSHFGEVHTRLSETDEFVRILREFPNFPVSFYFDVREALERIRLEGRFLEVEELFDLKRALETLRAVVSFFSGPRSETLPLLSAKASQIRVYPYIAERIDTVLNKSGKIRDNASPELAKIRSEILSLQSGISKRLHAILKQAQREGWVDEDASVAIRDGRAVIPVLSANKRKLKGIVYDESATGKTAYVEPTEIVEMNNEIRELEYAERREIIRILISVSSDIRPYIDDLIYANAFLGEIDFIRAKAALAIDFGALRPDLYDESLLDWRQAVHPLLMLSLRRENRTIVPLDIRLDRQDHILLISGPNAGGKSVCLKTVGLLQYMLQCGLLIPVQEGSKTGLFRHIFIDIGDEQSIDNDLSTYSSHLLNMKHFVRYSNERTLVLIDEFGTGTEPMLGGAIAEAILGKLNDQQVFGVITTHYTNLKHFASSVPGIVNGAMLYDSQKMDPLFRLEIGKPGSSFAFEIARKIGLPEEILQDATGKIGKKHIDFDKSLRSISRDKHYWETKRQKIRKVEKAVDEMADTYQKELEEVRQQRKEILKKAKEEAQQLLAGVNRQIENIIREIRESQADKERTKLLRQELEQLREQVKPDQPADDEVIIRKMEKLQKREKRRKQHLPEKPALQEPAGQEDAGLKTGDKVRLTGQEAIGELVSFNEKNAVVALGNLMMTVPLSNISRVSANEARKEQRKRGRSGLALTLDYSERRMNFKSEIDIRGMRAEEAIPLVQNFIDEAVMFEVSKLRILHGKGFGILKEMIRNFLRSEPMVASFRDEHVQFGGAGITIVELKN